MRGGRGGSIFFSLLPTSLPQVRHWPIRGDFAGYRIRVHLVRDGLGLGYSQATKAGPAGHSVTVGGATEMIFARIFCHSQKFFPSSTVA
jgi:hypothetical protein